MLRQTPDTFGVRRSLYQARLVFWLFIASLTMFFLGCIAIYLLLIDGIKNPRYDVPATFSYSPLELPSTFWFSTLALLITSVFLHFAAKRIANEKQLLFRRYIRIGLLFALIFLAFQSLGLLTLLSEHFSFSDQPGFRRLYGICFSISLIHALHVLGGVIYIGYIDYRGNRGAYDHEKHWAVDHCAWYWHFLDIVWLLMIAMFLFTR